MGRGCVGGGGGGGRLPAAIFALSQLYLSLSQLHLSFISVLSRRYLSIEIRLSPPHFALTHGYLTAISRLSHGYLPAIPSSAIPLWIHDSSKHSASTPMAKPRGARREMFIIIRYNHS